MLDSLSGETRLYPIIGDPIIYVRAPQRLTLKFEARGHNGICVPMQVKNDDLEAVLRGLSLIPNVDGLLVTMPHKITCFDYCTTSSETSRLLGVVSVTRRNADGSWHAGMLDGQAFVAAQVAEGAQPQGARALLLGAGGVGSAIAIALLDAGVRDLVIHDIDQTRVRKLVEIASTLGRGRVIAGPPDPRGCDIICNATPLGMAVGDPMPVDVGLLGPAMFVADVIAGHGITPFVGAAQAAGCKTSNGDQMVEAVMEIMPGFLLGA
jgi:shikimate dehydrogenase